MAVAGLLLCGRWQVRAGLSGCTPSSSQSSVTISPSNSPAGDGSLGGLFQTHVSFCFPLFLFNLPMISNQHYRPFLSLPTSERGKVTLYSLFFLLQRFCCPYCLSPIRGNLSTIQCVAAVGWLGPTKSP